MLRFSYKWFCGVTLGGDTLFNAEGPAFRGRVDGGRRDRGEGASLFYSHAHWGKMTFLLVTNDTPAGEI
ncbi:MAG: hypothetical protein RLZ33_592 [Bacteroidota bacterium]|jgi:hypothetical protein